MSVPEPDILGQLLELVFGGRRQDVPVPITQPVVSKELEGSVVIQPNEIVPVGHLEAVTAVGQDTQTTVQDTEGLDAENRNQMFGCDFDSVIRLLEGKNQLLTATMRQIENAVRKDVLEVAHRLQIY
jgi:hypothetical protein